MLKVFSLGRDLSVERIGEIGAIATAHGFSFSQLSSFGRPVADSRWASMNKVVDRHYPEELADELASYDTLKTGGKNGSNSLTERVARELRKETNGKIFNGHAKSATQKESHQKRNTRQQNADKQRKNRRARTLFQRYINPVLVNLAEQGGLSKTFVRAQDTVVTDAEENHYLDFVFWFWVGQPWAQPSKGCSSST